MKCRRSKSSRGSLLRGPGPKTTREPPAASKQRRQGPPAVPAPAHDAVPAVVLRIDGHSEGSIHHAGTVSVGPQGAVVGDIHATTIFVEGEITGNLLAALLLRVAAGAKIVGDLCAPRIAVARGAQLCGNITMRPRLSPPSDLDELAVDTLLTAGRLA
jgi:Polymer-forming cytoskeletal